LMKLRAPIRGGEPIRGGRGGEPIRGGEPQAGSLHCGGAALTLTLTLPSEGVDHRTTADIGGAAHDPVGGDYHRERDLLAAPRG